MTNVLSLQKMAPGTTAAVAERWTLLSWDCNPANSITSYKC